ncbi:proton-conducting transporter membrane subunit [Candidatus Nesciobacter abundans]|uniref:NADH:quinone oxidoreductase/Mrp antiporter transmembrane domain-containing protein n=1 Tax=Candidatus Nesciobacter abundans TaxID=2601668 RepID=A0A5C0UGG2_9PROT|nr:proton-conducting transporter membrane subunit [Candidatus Nesciobacter abundans]QEK39158.1 hypothetical protein FZC36_01775 [Candidatus Nesciobacter abundans]
MTLNSIFNFMHIEPTEIFFLSLILFCIPIFLYRLFFISKFDFGTRFSGIKILYDKEKLHIIFLFICFSIIFFGSKSITTTFVKKYINTGNMETNIKTELIKNLTFALLFISWEVTTWLSYFLMYKNAEDKKEARIPLITNLLGGLFFMIFVALSFKSKFFLGNEIGDLRSLEAISNFSKFFYNYKYFKYLNLNISDLIGISAAIFVLTKSSQFPFCWLDYAKNASPYVSAFLHSCTLVKMGVFMSMFHLSYLHTNVFFKNTIIFSSMITSLSILKNLNREKLDLKKYLASTTQIYISFLLFYSFVVDSFTIMKMIFVHCVYKSVMFLTCQDLKHAKQVNLQEIIESKSNDNVSIATGSGDSHEDSHENSNKDSNKDSHENSNKNSNDSSASDYPSSGNYIACPEALRKQPFSTLFIWISCFFIMTGFPFIFSSDLYKIEKLKIFSIFIKSLHAAFVVNFLFKTKMISELKFRILNIKSKINHKKGSVPVLEKRHLVILYPVLFLCPSIFISDSVREIFNLGPSSFNFTYNIISFLIVSSTGFLIFKATKYCRIKSILHKIGELSNFNITNYIYKAIARKMYVLRDINIMFFCITLFLLSVVCQVYSSFYESLSFNSEFNKFINGSLFYDLFFVSSFYDKLFFLFVFTGCLCVFSRNKLNIIVGLNFIGLGVTSFFMRYGGSDIAVTNVIADILITIILLNNDKFWKNDHRIVFSSKILKILFYSFLFSAFIVAKNPALWQSVSSGFYFPSETTVNDVVINLRLFDTWGETLVFLISGIVISSQIKNKKYRKNKNQTKK